jgi:DNA-binding ferritin-like protein
MKSPEEIAHLRSKMIEHLEAALALADETGDGTARYMIESALDSVRAELWPGN